MKFDRPAPCGNCPFRSSKKAVRLSSERVHEICDQQEVFPCHKTVDYSEDSGGRMHHETRACAGFIKFKMSHEGFNQNMQIAERLGIFSPADYEGDAGIVGSREEVMDAT
jgi:hypothetical protein